MHQHQHNAPQSNTPPPPAPRVKYIRGDLFRHVTAGPAVIGHVNNDFGGWGAGFVLAVSQHHPRAEQAYLDWAAGGPVHGAAAGCLYPIIDAFRLHAVQLVPVGEQLWVANMVAQRSVPGRRRACRYNALARCLDAVARHCLAHGASFHCPLMGAGIGGGDWGVIEALLEDCLVLPGVPVTAYELPPAPRPAGRPGPAGSLFSDRTARTAPAVQVEHVQTNTPAGPAGPPVPRKPPAPALKPQGGSALQPYGDGGPGRLRVW